MKQVTFGYGILCDPLEEQANQQGFTLGKIAYRLDIVRESINHLRIHDLLTYSEMEKIHQRLHKLVIESLQPMEDEK